MKYLKKFATEEEYAAFVESGQMQRPNVSLVEEPFTTYYNKYIPLGVFIQHVDGTLYTEDDWTSGGFSNDEANGVAVVADNAKFVIAKDDASAAKRWASDTSTLINGVFIAPKGEEAKTDFSGKKNTELMLSVDTNGAGYSCANYVFPNGEKGYLPALGEWNTASQNKSAINEAMTLIGGTEPNSVYWSSTQEGGSSAWCLSWSSGGEISYIKSNGSKVRAFAPLDL